MESRRTFLAAAALARVLRSAPSPPTLEQVRFRRTWEKQVVVNLDPAGDNTPYLAYLFTAHGCKVSASTLPEKLVQLAPWTENVRAVSDIAVLVREPACYAELDRAHFLYDLADAAADLSAYKVVVAAPDVAVKLNAYRTSGGTVVQFPSERFLTLLHTMFARPSIVAPDLAPEAAVTLLEQRAGDRTRHVIHIVYFPDGGSTAGQLKNVRLSVLLPRHPKQVMTVPENRVIDFKRNENYVAFTIPRILGHQAVVIE